MAAREHSREPAVLRLALLVKTERGENLDPSDDRLMDLRRERKRGVELTVHTETYACLSRRRLDMNVGGTPVYGVAQDARDDLSDRRILFDYSLPRRERYRALCAYVGASGPFFGHTLIFGKR